MPEHSPTWTAERHGDDEVFVLEDDRIVARLKRGVVYCTDPMGDAARIVRAVNMHEEFVELCEDWLKTPDIRQPYLRDKLAALLAKAKGE